MPKTVIVNVCQNCGTSFERGWEQKYCGTPCASEARKAAKLAVVASRPNTLSMFGEVEVQTAVVSAAGLAVAVLDAPQTVEPAEDDPVPAPRQDPDPPDPARLPEPRVDPTPVPRVLPPERDPRRVEPIALSTWMKAIAPSTVVVEVPTSEPEPPPAFFDFPAERVPPSHIDLTPTAPTPTPHPISLLNQGALFDVGQIPTDDTIPVSKEGNLARKFGVPPFTTLDARSGAWKIRKSAWIDLGIKSELGRGEVMKSGGLYTGKADWLGYRGPRVSDEPGRSRPTNSNGKRPNYGMSINMSSLNRDMSKYESLPGTGTSIFDPVLCELTYRWYCPQGGRVVDPFAGGSVRGAVASMLGRYYVGIDLSEPQIMANREQLDTICRPRMSEDLFPVWIHGDSNAELDAFDDESFDLVFSCPPYADLEVYSEDPRDLSTMKYPDFIDVYGSIIAKSLRKLKPNRFAVFVVGDVRAENRCYRCFPEDTIRLFREAGAEKYCEGILLTSLGSLPVRVSAHFKNNRMLGKAHQNYLVFVKGDPEEAVKACDLDKNALEYDSWEDE